MLYLDECSSGKSDDPLDQKSELNLLTECFKALIYLLLFEIQNTGFHRHVSLMQCQLIGSQVKQLPLEVYITIACILESQNFQNMLSFKVHF